MARFCERNFGIGLRQAQQYMRLARSTPDGQKRIALRNSTLRETIRELTPNYGKPVSWREGVQDNIDRARRDAERIRDEQLTRQQEREAERLLALKLIDIGYKVS